MLHSIAGYVLTDPSSTNFKHVVYLGQDGHLHDLVYKEGEQWKYNVDITAEASATITYVNGVVAAVPSLGLSPIDPVPNAVGYVGVSVARDEGYYPQIIYKGADSQLYVLYPVVPGYFYPGNASLPPDTDDPPDPGEGVGDGPEIPGTGDPSATIPPSPAGWFGISISYANAISSVLAIYSGTPDGQTNIVFVSDDGSGDIYKSVGTSNDWGGTPAGYPIDVVDLAGRPSVGSDASAFYWSDDGTEHVFSVDSGGRVKELWSKQAAVQWGAHDVQHEVKVAVPGPKGTLPTAPIAPPAMSGSGMVAGYVFPGNTKNVAYVDANGINVHLCSHSRGGVWSIAHISVDAISPPPKSEPGLLESQVPTNPSLSAYVSDRVHVVYYDFSGTIVDLWSDDGSNWNWGWPIQAANGIVHDSGGGPLAPLAHVPNGLATFVWQSDSSDHILYVGQDGHIWELSLKQGSAVQTESPSSGLPWTATDVTALVASDPRYSPPVMG